MIEATISLEKFEYFFLILIRVASFISVAPLFSQSNVPQRIKIGLSLFLTVIFYNMLPVQEFSYTGVVGYATLIIKESIAGLLIGFSAYICFMIINLAGRIIDMEIGLAMAQQFDPTTRTQTGITGTLYSYLIMMIMLASDMHIYLINAILESFSLIPLGGANLGESLYGTMVGFISDYFIIGFRIALPIFSAIIIMNCILGIMAKVAPQMHMFSVGIQLKLLTGFFIMFVTVRLIPSISNFVSDTMKNIMDEVMKGLV